METVEWQQCTRQGCRDYGGISGGDKVEIMLVYFNGNNCCIVGNGGSGAGWWHRWELPAIRYHSIMVIYPYPFLC